VQGLGFRVQGLGVGDLVIHPGLTFHMYSSQFNVKSAGRGRVEGLGFRV
jgi:hypothetical protein